MPWGFGGGPWWTYNQKDLRRFGRYRGRCFRFPYLPRWWWRADPEYFEEPTPKEEKKMLTEELKALQEEMKAIEERLKELDYNLPTASSRLLRSRAPVKKKK